jgi:hypothetical protein
VKKEITYSKMAKKTKLTKNTPNLIINIGSNTPPNSSVKKFPNIPPG